MRTQELVKKQNSAQSDLDQAMANLHQAEASVKIKQGAFDKAKADLDHCTITRRSMAMVISRNVDVGQTVAASLQAPVIFTIANDLTKMQIDSNVAEADVGAVHVDQTVDFTVDAFPNRTFHGKGRASAQRADHGAKRRDLRHGDRGHQSRSEIETGHDGERFHHHRAYGRCVENKQCGVALSSARIDATVEPIQRTRRAVGAGR